MVICDVIGIYDYVAIFPTSVLTLSERQYISGDIFGWKLSWKQRSRNIKFVYKCFTDVAFCSIAGASMGWFVGLTILPLLYKHSEYLSEHNWVPYLILGGFALVGGIAILCAHKVWNIKCYEMSVCFFHNYWCGLITIHIIGTLHWNFFLLISN